jgi:hypothetical protein
MDIKASKFVKRQTRTSDYSYFKGSWEILESLTEDYFEDKTRVRQGYRDGVVLVNIHNHNDTGFFSAVVPITDDIKFETIFEARREGEEKYKKSVAYGKKVPARNVDIILYRKDVLEEDETDRESLTGADWEIVSINCSPYDYDLPMTPTAMARNILSTTDHPFGKGGSADTKTTALQLAESIAFWNQHTTIREKE